MGASKPGGGLVFLLQSGRTSPTHLRLKENLLLSEGDRLFANCTLVPLRNREYRPIPFVFWNVSHGIAFYSWKSNRSITAIGGRANQAREV